MRAVAKQESTVALPHSLAGLTVFERGWLSSNNILIHAAPPERGAVLVDSSHVNHAEQTVALVRHALRGQGPRADEIRRPPPEEVSQLGSGPALTQERLDRVLNTHLHSDHCGGNAALQREFGVPVFVPPGLAHAVRAWDTLALSHEATGQRSERFTMAGTLAPGEKFVAGAREWQVLAAPGHDPHSVLLFDAAHGVLISADALWEQGFGVVFPELEGEPGFDDVAAVLSMIEQLPVRVVIPGHGAPFTDVEGALLRARKRLAGMVADPARHARHAMKVLIKYHMMEEREMALDALLAWAAATPAMCGTWQRYGAHESASAQSWCEQFVHELVGSGALALRDGTLHDV
jgi:glyoxylase-like metal-dependent hydrolase (beta-lactamase superfamily II)